MKFVDIKNDVAFRKIFGNENKKEILISFLNAILDLQQGRLIVSIEIQNPYLLPEIKDLKSSILDVKVTDQRDITYIVEMQVEEPDGFEKRVQYYTARQYSQQIEKGEDYPKLNQVVFIGILNFKFFEGKDYITQHLIINTKTGKQELKDFEFNFIELPNFKKKITECGSLVDKWIYFIKNSTKLEVIPANVDDEGLKLAYQDADKHNWTKAELDAYDYASMRKQDEIGKLELAEKRGENKKAIEMAKELIVLNLPKEQIIQVTKLPLVVIENLLNQKKI
jgi:predicted transposase/invertase (TIGR01784 family)